MDKPETRPTVLVVDDEPNILSSLIELVNDLLDLARLEAGQTRLNRQALTVSELLAESVRALAYNAQAKEIVVQLEIRPGESSIWADRLKLRQVYNNLLSNAIKFTPRGGRVWVVVEPEPGGVRVSVSDTGLGIRADELPRLFEKFAQTHTQATAGEKGTGLGLAIAKQVVELHAGHIEVTSVVNEGSTFTVHLPAGEPRDAVLGELAPFQILGGAA